MFNNYFLEFAKKICYAAPVMQPRSELEKQAANASPLSLSLIAIEILLDIRERLAISNQHTTVLVERLNKIEGFIYGIVDADDNTKKKY